MDDIATHGTTQSTVESVKENDVLKMDEVTLKQILPVEVWKIVTEKLPKTSRENLQNSSLFFHNQLESQKTTLLFEKVFPLVAQTIWRNQGLQGLPVSDVLKCRSVCSHWNTVIDKLIPQKLQHFDNAAKTYPINRFPNNNAFKLIIFNSFKNYTESDRELPQNFVKHFDATHNPANNSKRRNPFIWPNVSINIYAGDIPEDEDDEEYIDYQNYLEGITIMLSKYGHYIHNFDLYITSYQFYQNTSLLHNWFTAMPNIKQLYFHVDNYIDNVNDAESFLEGNYQHEDYPFPKFIFLEQLTCNTLPTPVFTQLVKKNSHVSELDVSFWDEKFSKNLFTINFTNLKKLRVDGCPGDLIENLGGDQVQWPLECLMVTLNNERVKDGGCASFFKVIQDKFANTLVNLELKLEENEEPEKEGPLWRDFINCRLYLLNLKEIKLFVVDRPISLDFLLPMEQNLEEISITFSCKFLLEKEATLMGNSGTIVQFAGFERNMLESNIWGIFKSLNKINLDWRQSFSQPPSDWRRPPELERYSRNDWMQKMEKLV